VDRRIPGRWTVRGVEGPEYRRLDLVDADWSTLLADVDVVHHYAWSSVPASANANPGSDLQSNMTLTVDLLDALRRRGRGRLVFASSGGSVYGRLRHAPAREDHSIAPLTAYGAGKATAETYLSLYRSLYGVDCRIARIANPYGAGQNPRRGLGAVTTFAFNALHGRPIAIWGDGETIRDYVHVSDIAEGLLALASAPALGSEFAFNLGSGTGVSLNQIVAELELQLGRPVPVSRGEARSFDIPVSVLAVGLARRRLGWRPRLSFEEGLAQTLTDLRGRRTISNLGPGSRVEATRVRSRPLEPAQSGGPLFATS